MALVELKAVLAVLLRSYRVEVLNKASHEKVLCSGWGSGRHGRECNMRSSCPSRSRWTRRGTRRCSSWRAGCPSDSTRCRDARMGRGAKFVTGKMRWRRGGSPREGFRPARALDEAVAMLLPQLPLR